MTFAPSAFRPVGGSAFLPAVRLAGLAQQPQAFYGAVSLGQDVTQTARDWYERAKNAIDRFRFLKTRLEAIDYKPERENIKTWLGDPNIPGTPEYRFARVQDDFTSDVAAEGIGAYNKEQRQMRVAELEGMNNTFEEKVTAAAKLYGERPPTTPGTQPAAKGPDLTVPLLVAGGVVALAILFR